MSDEKDESVTAVVAIKPCCNRLVFAAVNKPNVMDKEMLEEIGKLAQLGCKIETWTVKSVRVGPWGCRCR